MTSQALSCDGIPIDWCQRCECAVIHEPILCEDCIADIAILDEEFPLPEPPAITAEDIDRDLAPLSRSACARRGIAHSSEDHATNELIELPAPEYRRNALLVAAERIGR